MPTNMPGVIMCRTLVLAALAFLVQACVTSPYNGQLVTDPSGPVTVTGFSHQPRVTLTIEAANPTTGAWEVLGTTTSAATPTLAAGTWQNSPPLYWYSTTVQVSDPAHPQTMQRWGSFADDGFATLRVRSGDFNLYTGQEHSPDCVSQRASQTEDFYTTAWTCGYQYHTWQIRYLNTAIVPPAWLSIDAVDPPVPLDNQTLTVRYTVFNPTYGQVHGRMTGGIAGQALTHVGSAVIDLAPGRSYSGQFRTGQPLAEGTHTIRLDFGGNDICTPNPPRPPICIPTVSASATHEVKVEPFSPPFNEVLQKASHNAYDNAESLIDQLLYHRIRHLDIDLHVSHSWRDPTPGDWWVYHVDAGSLDHGWLHSFHQWDFTRCATLRGCLQTLRAFHDAVPEHEVITLTLEPQDELGNDSHHGAAELDAVLHDVLGQENIFTPSELLERCDKATSLRQAVGSLPSQNSGCTWPRLNELRGKFMILMMNADSYFDAAAAPHTGDPGWKKRLAFRLTTGVHRPGDERDDQLFYGTSPEYATYFFQQKLITRVEYPRDYPSWDVAHLRCPNLTGNPTNCYGADNAEDWNAFVASNTQILSTNAINEHRSPFASTHNAYGYPFQCAPAAAACNLSSAVETTNSFELHVAADDVAGTSDSLGFLYNDVETGLSEWTALLSTVSNDVDEWARGCLTARQSLSPSSPHLSVCKAADTKGLFIQVRAEGCRGPCGTAHGNASMENSMATPRSDTYMEEEAAFVKLVVVHDSQGAHACAFGSFDGQRWKAILADGRQQWDFPGGLPLQGLSATSHGVDNRNADDSPLRFVFANVRRNGALLSGSGAFDALASIGNVAHRELVVDGKTVPR